MGRGLDGYFYPSAMRCGCLCSFEGPWGGVLSPFPVVIAWGKHLFPFRTEQLSPTAPMVLGSQGPGRVGRRRFSVKGRPRRGGLSSFWRRLRSARLRGVEANHLVVGLRRRRRAEPRVRQEELPAAASDRRGYAEVVVGEVAGDAAAAQVAGELDDRHAVEAVLHGVQRAALQQQAVAVDEALPVATGDGHVARRSGGR